MFKVLKMTFKISFWVLSGLILLFALFLWLTLWHNSEQSISELEQQFANELLSRAELEEVVFPVESIAKFSWEVVCITPHGFSAPEIVENRLEEMRQSTGVPIQDLSDVISNGIHENYWTLVFLDTQGKPFGIRLFLSRFRSSGEIFECKSKPKAFFKLRDNNYSGLSVTFADN